MDLAHADLIRDHYEELMESIQTAVEDVCLHIWEANIINNHMKENILEGKNNRQSAEALLDMIVTRGPNAFEALYQAVINAHLIAAADILKPPSTTS